MGLTESISLFISQGLQELTAAEVSFGFKLMAIFGVIYLFNSVMKSGGSVIEILIYIIALVKWVSYKILKKDI